MTRIQRKKLIEGATKLLIVGQKIEYERKLLKSLVANGVQYNAPEMLEALQRFEKYSYEWKQLEVEHLTLRDSLQK